MTEELKRSGLNRRSVVKGAAWAMPVVAAATLVPLASASTVPTWNVAITGTCSGNFKAAGLGSALLNRLTTTLGLDEAVREFTIMATQGTVPTGTEFSFASGGLVNVELLTVSSSLGANALSIVSVGSGAVLTLTQDLPEGGFITIDLLSGVADVKLAGTTSLTLSSVGDSDPADNTASITTGLGTTVNALVTRVNLQVCGN